VTAFLQQPVIAGARFVLAHTPGLVCHGSKPTRDIARDPALAGRIRAHLRDFAAAVAYPPNQAFLGALHPDRLADLPQPWFEQPANGATRRAPHGELLPEEAFYGLLKACDAFGLVHLAPDFAARACAALADHPLLRPGEAERLAGTEPAQIEALLAARPAALPLLLRDGTRVGAVRGDHAEDTSLLADVLLENLACKVTAAWALRQLLADGGCAPGAAPAPIDPAGIDYVINCGEEAVGDRYQRGGGNLGKAVAELCGCANATGVDVKGFCCGPVHALVVAAGLVAAGIYGRVAVVGGCSLAKLGMKYQGHLAKGHPVLEDVLAGAAVLVTADDGRSPRIRLDALGRHTVAAGSSQKAIFEALVSGPLAAAGLGFRDIDKYATELQNPELTEPSGSGNVPLLNYRVLAGLAALRGEIAPADVPDFVAAHGMPGFSPTQGHIASALPFLGHALDGLRAGTLTRAMFLAKGSLFLGRMTQLSDGVSFILERNG